MHLRHEPRFELPPQIAVDAERRLSAQVLASWETCRLEASLPAAVDFDGVWPSDIRKHMIRVRLTAEGDFEITTISTAVASAFSLRIGRLVTGRVSRLSSRLAMTMATVRQTLRPAQFEATLAGAEPSLRMLTRAVVLPLAGPDGRFSEAAAVVTWKRALSPAAHVGLQREIDLALATGAGLRARIDAFATDAPPVTIAAS